MNNRLELSDLFSYGHTSYYQFLAATHIRLDQYTDAKSGVVLLNDTRGGTDSGLKPKSSHPRTAANIAFGHRSALRIIQCAKDVLLFYMKAIDIVESAVPGLGHHRKTEIFGA